MGDDGDIVPVAAARTLTVLEVLVGQIYLVVLVARLVGMQIAEQVGVRTGGWGAASPRPSGTPLHANCAWRGSG